MALIYQLRGTTLQAYYCDGDREVMAVSNVNGNQPFVAATTASGIFGNSIIKMDNGTQDTLVIPGPRNWPMTGAWSVLMRVVPTVSSSTYGMPLFQVGPPINQTPGGLKFYIDNGDCVAVAQSPFSNLGVKFTTTKVTMTAGVPRDLMLTWDGSGNSGSMKFSADGVEIGTMTPNDSIGSANLPSVFTGGMIINLVNGAAASGNFDLNELVIWDTQENHVYSTRTDFYSTTSSPFWGRISTDPGVANVLSATAYTINGTSLTGTYNPPTSSDPGVGNVLSGTSYIINDTTLTGTYHDATYSDPGTANVRNGTSYIFNDTTQTGSLLAPEVGSGAAGTVDLNNIKEQVQTILETNNTTTSSIVDLSDNLTSRVQAVYKLNPMRCFIQATDLPWVSVFVDSKEVDQQGTLKNQSTGKKRATINLKIVAAVYNDAINTVDNDEADEDLQYLMENIEKIIRANDTLNDTVDWSLTQGITYEDAPLNEETVFRVGILDLEARVLY